MEKIVYGAGNSQQAASLYSDGAPLYSLAISLPLSGTASLSFSSYEDWNLPGRLSAILQRASRALYNLLANDIFRLDYDRSKATCRVMAGHLADIAADQAGWGQVAEGQNETGVFLRKSGITGKGHHGSLRLQWQTTAYTSSMSGCIAEQLVTGR
ncbi:hypothetical protein [Pseudomonas piscis]|uniref:hypothetical protein n=1 Tax=Pseudomonas piscis TaxID=2614538 RepID=UPI0021D5BCA6|nr:hypothetical protein [Pseudomonas piscis]MCU7650513.1 hypothetical protein [Pseudomonas piscis]